MPTDSTDRSPVSDAPVAVAITYRHLEKSPALSQRIDAEAQRLRRYCSGIQRCHVVVEGPPHHQTDGRLVGLHFEIHVPGDVLVISHEAAGTKSDDVYALVRRAFDAARRQVEDYSRRRREDNQGRDCP